MQDKKTPEQYMEQTKATLVEQIMELHRVIEGLAEQLASRNALLTETGEPGWLVTTPVADYSGTLYGVRFESGRAFLPAGHPEAEYLIGEFRDFGYTVQEMAAKDFKALSHQPVREKSLAEEISLPAMMGGS
jgi:hypothetical protein